jgi:group II intron reverse transcriptase/maturase
MYDLLDQALELSNLHQAWEAIEANQGVPGVDGVSLQAWRRTWEERIHLLILKVRSNSYQPGKLRRRKIPKRTPGEYRLLRMPTITDRVLQRAVLQVLHPVFEGKFLESSFGYRPNRGLAQAVQRILVLRENGYRWLLDADIDEFFDHVDHALLLRFLEADLPDPSLLPLIRPWLALSCDNPQAPLGIPLGSPLSPLWANVVLHRLDCSVARRGWPMVRYADDFIVFTESADLLPEITRAVGKMLASLKLRFEPSKTRPASFTEGFDFLGVHFEGDEYRFTYLDKEIAGRGKRVDWLYGRYLPEY